VSDVRQATSTAPDSSGPDSSGPDSDASDSEVTVAPGRRGVLESAGQRFVSQGYAATTVRQIADDSGIKAASIYHHFASKAELFVAVLDEGIRAMVDAFVAAQGDTTEPGAVRDRLFSHVRGHLGALFEHGPLTAAHVTAFFTAPAEVRAQVVPVRDGYEHLWNALLAELLPGLDPQQLPLLRLLLFGSMNATIEWFDPAGETTLDELAWLITEHFLGGAATWTLVEPTLAGGKR